MSRQRPHGTASGAGRPEQCGTCGSEEERSETWQQERARVLAQARVIVVKVGSAVLTDASGLSSPVLAGLAAQLAALRVRPRRLWGRASLCRPGTRFFWPTACLRHRCC